MDKRSFPKLLSAAGASPASAWMAGEKLSNWAGNLTYGTDRLHEVNTVEQVRAQVRAQPRMKVLGTRHCFNSIADSKHSLLSLKPMHEVFSIDSVARTVTVDAGITYGQLGPYLDGKGYALHNLASLPHISIAGACSTGTHVSPSSDRLVETPANSGTYVGNVIFDQSGQWVVRFHIHEECADVLEDSPHGHAAFRFTIP